MDKDLKNIFNKLPEKLEYLFEEYASKGKNISEIRLRSGFNARMCIDGIFSEIAGAYTDNKDINNIFMAFCDYTVSAFEQQIAQGYITLSGGHRIGLGGKYYTTDKTLIINNITSLNIRLNLHKEIIIGNDVTDFKKGLLIFGKPHSGKTTFIRNICYKLSRHNIVICDERDELYDYSLNCDYISGTKKHIAIMHAVRSMNPDIIVCDEIGDESESALILSGVNSGVKFICSVHSDNMNDLYLKPNVKILLDNKVFDKTVHLARENNNFFIKEIDNV